MKEIKFVRSTRLLLAGGLFALAMQVQAQVGSHYPVGAEGIKGASLPPSGVYLRDYNFFYTADTFHGGPPGFNVSAYVQAPRLIWMTDWKILGANYGMDIIVPLAYKHVELQTPGRKYSESCFGLGDIQVEPILLSWHKKQFDFSFGYAVWMPTGEFDAQHPEKAGNGFWTHMLTLGGVWYPDAEKTWAISLLNRYEINHEQEQTHITPGNMWTLEWGLSKTVCKGVDVGVIGYYQQLVTKDCGAGASGNLSHVVGVGPEISAFCSKLGLFTSLRYVYEADAQDRPQGHTVTLTLTKRF